MYSASHCDEEYKITCSLLVHDQSILAFITFAQSCILFFNRLLLSIDRRQSVEEAMDTVHLAVEYSSHVSSERYTRVVGIDLSGDPKVRVVCILNG